VSSPTPHLSKGNDKRLKRWQKGLLQAIPAKSKLMARWGILFRGEGHIIQTSSLKERVGEGSRGNHILLERGSGGRGRQATNSIWIISNQYKSSWTLGYSCFYSNEIAVAVTLVQGLEKGIGHGKIQNGIALASSELLLLKMK